MIKWLILGGAVAALSPIFYFVFRSVPGVGHWLGWVAMVIPVALALPFVLKGRRDR